MTAISPNTTTAGLTIASKGKNGQGVGTSIMRCTCHTIPSCHARKHMQQHSRNLTMLCYPILMSGGKKPLGWVSYHTVIPLQHLAGADVAGIQRTFRASLAR